MSDKIVFVLKKKWLINGKPVNLYEEIKSGRKTVEYRKAGEHWKPRLLKDPKYVTEHLSSFPKVIEGMSWLIDVTDQLKSRNAWFMVGFKKRCLPRLEAKISKLFLDLKAGTFHVHIEKGSVVEKTWETQEK